MPRTLAAVQPTTTESPCTTDLRDVADESIGRLTVVNQILYRRHKR